MRFAETSDGVRLAYESAGTGRPGMLLVHGWCCDHTYLAPQLTHFAPRYAVVAPDLRGHGDSDRPEPRLGTYDIETLADDVLVVAEEAGLERPLIVGHSLGALVALACAARPGAVRAAVMIEPAPMFPGRHKEHLQRSVPDVAEDHDGSWRRDFAAGLLKSTDTVRRAETMATMAAVPPPIASAVLHSFARFDGGGPLERAEVPLLAITAGSGERELREHRAVTVGRTVGAGHFPQLEVPEQVNAMIDRFLAINGFGAP
ncbi:alpha/beta fold hydrolase [Rugosimonospora africana]|uniref:alpha/beta fold hydrolase n=1 Tax=Rugosimonospora africana TaxID=556532 RepID=UPI0019457A6A|nr:alpha/beta hydrolase [Rugosimonospora africana]